MPRTRMAKRDPLLAESGDETALSTGLEAAGLVVHISSILLDPCGQLLHQVVHRAILADLARDLGRCMDHGGVVAAAELLADLRQYEAVSSRERYIATWRG